MFAFIIHIGGLLYTQDNTHLTVHTTWSGMTINKGEIGTVGAHGDHHIVKKKNSFSCTDVVEYHMHTANYHITLDS
jgi:hypothetical protein